MKHLRTEKKKVKKIQVYNSECFSSRMKSTEGNISNLDLDLYKISS